jgi:hypothetical protein
MKKALCAFAVCAVASLAMTSSALANGGYHSPPPPTTCNGTLTGVTINNNVVVPDNGTCILIASTVNGNVSVKKHSYFEANASTINGSITSFRSTTVFVHDGTKSKSISAFLTQQVFAFDSTITSGSLTVIGSPISNGQINSCGMNVQHGNINVFFSGSDILIGDPLTLGCAGNTVNGEVNVSANYVQVELVVRGNTISDDLALFFNRGPAGKFVEANVGGDELVCKGNSSPFTAAANVGWNQKKGQCSGP